MVSLAGVQVAPCAVYALPSGRRQTCLHGEKHVFSKTNWKMGHQGRQNCDNLKWLYMVAFVKKTKTKTQFQEPLQDPSLQLTQSICIKPSHTTLGTSPHGHYMEFVNLLGFPGGKESAGEESARNAGDLGLIPGLGRSPGEGNSYPL